MKKLTTLTKQIAIILVLSFLLLECVLRFLPYLLNDPLKSFFLEANRIPLLNIRIHKSIWSSKKFGIIIPPPTQKEIAFIGDSFVFGSYVHQDSCFANLIGAKLNTSIVNLGIPNTSLETYNRMCEVSLRYKPKKIIYCIFGGNDFAEKTTIDTTSIPNLTQTETYKAYNTDLFLTEENLTWDYKLHLFFKKLTNFSVAYQVGKLFFFGNKETQLNKTLSYHTKDSFGNNFALFDKKYWDKAINIENPLIQNTFLENLCRVKKIATFAHHNQIEFHVVLIPFKEMVHGQLVPEKEFVYRTTYHDCFNKAVLALQKENISCYDATEDLIQVAKNGKKLYFTIDGHFTETGNSVMADLLIKRFNLQK
jgi:hypothetical protein